MARESVLTSAAKAMISLAIVDDHQIVIDGIKSLLKGLDNFNVVLVAFNAANCTDTFSARVSAIVTPVLDVPNAFTPGKFGENGLIRVYGYGIGKMEWKIYNRWGQLVFSTSTLRQGWDGTYKGVLQPMDVYTYTLDVEFTDGQKLRKTGDITLLR